MFESVFFRKDEEENRNILGVGNLFSLRNEKKWKPLPLYHRQETVKVHFLLSEKK